MDQHSFDARFARYLAAARSAWPQLEVEAEHFQRYAAARAAESELPPEAHAADLLLACGCSLRLAAALRAFDREYRPVIARVLGRRGTVQHMAEEALQQVFERLLVATPDNLPKIVEYKGHGPLKSWVSTTAATTLLMMQRSAARRREDDPLDDEALPIAGLDPELANIAQRYQGEMREAIVRALGCLTDRERVLLRLQLGEGMSIDQLGAMYSVNRATAARWLAAARASVMKHTRAALSERRGLSDSEFDSILQLVRSRLDVSILRHLA